MKKIRTLRFKKSNDALLNMLLINNFMSLNIAKHTNININIPKRNESTIQKHTLKKEDFSPFM